MGIGYIQPKKFGSVTEPVPFPLALPSAESKTARDHGLLSSVSLPGGRGTMIANGMDPLRHIIDGDVYRTGLLAPKSACTATPSGVRATAVLNIDATSGGATPYTIANDDQITLGLSVIFFVSAISSRVGFPRVLIGATPSITLDNLRHLFDGTGTKGVQYEYPAWFVSNNFVEVTAKDAWSVSFRVKRYGSNGNALAAYLSGLAGTWTDCSLGSTTTTVGTAGFFENGADGSGTSPAAGTYNHRYQYFRKGDGALSGASPTVESQQDEAMNIALAVIAAPLSDDDIDYKRWLRTNSGGSKLYRGADILEADTTDTDTISNTIIETHVAYDELIHRLWEGGMIERVRYIAEYDGRWVGGGHIPGADYTRGTCSVHGADASDATATNVVTLASDGHVTKEMEHWTFQTAQSTVDDALEYDVIYVDEDAEKLYLHQDWLGVTATGKAFKIRDTRDPFRLYYSEPVLPNNTSSAMNIDGVQSPDPAGITGLFNAFESLIVFTGTGIWRLSGSHPFRLTHEFEGVGCVSGHSIVLVDDILYWLGADGIYAWQGSGDPFKASSPPGEPRGIARTIARINTQHAHSAFVHYDPESRIIRWFVPLDTNITNRHAIVFDVQTKAWGLDTANDITYAKTVNDKDGNLRTLAGDIYGHVWELDVSNTDGAYGFEPVQTVTSPTTVGFSVTGTPLPASSALKGSKVWFMDGDGDFTHATVATNTTSAVTYTTRLASAPAAGMPVVFGGIHQRIESGWFSYDEKNLRKIFEAIRVAFAYKSEGQYWVSVATNQETVAVLDPDGGSLTTLDGEEIHWVRMEGKRLKIRIDTIGPGFDPAFQALEAWVRVRDG